MARTLNQDFFKAWTPEMAYVLGYFAADGSMVVNMRGSRYIEFTSTDPELLQIVQAASGSNQVIGVRPSRSEHWKKQHRLQIGSKEWFRDLSKLGFSSCKSFSLRFPPVPDDLTGHFVRGYFDGDGCVYFKKLTYADRKNPRWSLLTLFTSGSAEFLEQLHARLKSFGGVRGGSLRKKARGYDLRFSHRDSLALYRLMYNTDEIANRFLPRKREKLANAIQVLGLDKELRS